MKSVLAISTLVAVCLSGSANVRAATPEQCPSQPVDIGRGVEIVHALRAYTGADGASHVQEIDVKGTTATHMGTVKVTLWNLGAPTKAALVYGFPNVAIPVHPALGRSMFILLSGSSEMHLLDGQIYKMTPGTIFIAEDLGSTGRGGKAGPCGYVALDLQYPTSAPVLPLEPKAP